MMTELQADQLIEMLGYIRNALALIVGIAAGMLVRSLFL